MAIGDHQQEECSMRDSAKVLVTGGAGFIGSHLVDRLIHGGYDVRVIDNLSTGKLENIEEYFENDRFDFVNGDIRDFELVKKCVHDVEAVFHLAAITSVPLSIQYPNLTYKTNVAGTYNLLSSCAKQAVAKLVFISSCSIYGEPKYLPVDELHSANPISPYAESKLMSERDCLDFQKKKLLNTVVLRLFNVYGPRQGINDYSGVITQFINRCRQRLPLIIDGDGSQTRDFVYVRDVVEAVFQAFQNDAIDGEVFNIGVGEPTSINELAKDVLELTGSDLEVLYRPSRLGDVKETFADISKAEKLLEYEPRFSLKAGLAALIGGNVKMQIAGNVVSEIPNVET
jgi:nucleoside-diphosphate-sugar epimerase